uniref:Uncharacterized protein n=1 Tax=Acrobeloides nanus TaxID=290746 RepID=A0A914DX14_9BILA
MFGHVLDIIVLVKLTSQLLKLKAVLNVMLKKLVQSWKNTMNGNKLSQVYVKKCSFANCQDEYSKLENKFIQSINNQKPAYPGKERCEYEGCLETCLYKNIGTCDNKNFKNFYKIIKDIDSRINALVLSGSEPDHNGPDDL